MVYMWVVCGCAGCELVAWLHCHVQGVSDDVCVGWSVSTWVVCGCAGCELVAWLHSHVQGLSDRREARKYATAMLHAGLIRHTVNKTSFSEQCYYTLGDLGNITTPGTPYTHLPVTPGILNHTPPPVRYTQSWEQNADNSRLVCISQMAFCEMAWTMRLQLQDNLGKPVLER